MVATVLLLLSGEYFLRLDLLGVADSVVQVAWLDCPLLNVVAVLPLRRRKAVVVVLPVSIVVSLVSGILIPGSKGNEWRAVLLLPSVLIQATVEKTRQLCSSK